MAWDSFIVGKSLVSADLVLQEATIPEPWTSIVIKGIGIIPHSTKVKVLCGDQHATWNQLEMAIFIAVEIAATPGMNAEFLRVAWANIAKVSGLRAQRVRDTPPSILDLLAMFRHTQCFDPRDKVYVYLF